MASTRTVLQEVCAQLQAVMPDSPSVQLAVGWPPEDAIMSVPKTSVCIGSVFDAGPAPMDRTRWHAINAIPDANVSPTTTATLSGSGFLTVGQTATVTIGGTTNAADAIGVQVNAQAATYVVLLSDTLDTIAAGLAAAINESEVAATASATGAVVTITATGSIVLSVATSNVGTRTTEYHRKIRFVRAIIWCDSEANRELLGDPIDLLLSQLEQSYGFQVPNNEWVRVLYDGDFYDESLQLKDIYRADFRMRLEYGVTGSETVYPVVGTDLTQQGSY